MKEYFLVAIADRDEAVAKFSSLLAVIVPTYGCGQSKEVRQAIHSIYCAMVQPVKDPQTEAHLPSLDQLRNNAAECIRLAEAARTSAHKSFFIEMADRWLTLAERAQKTQDR